MHFEIYGSFKILRVKRKRTLVDSSKERLNQFWEEVEEAVSCLSDACGCYIMIIGARPWYVGKAEKQSFRKECFTHHKLNLYTKALHERRGVPRLFLLPQVTGKGALRKPTSGKRPAIQFLETMLIGIALQRNPKLLNQMNTKLLRDLSVPGLMNYGKGKARANSVQELRGILGV